MQGTWSDGTGARCRQALRAPVHKRAAASASRAGVKDATGGRGPIEQPAAVAGAGGRLRPADGFHPSMSGSRLAWVIHPTDVDTQSIGSSERQLSPLRVLVRCHVVGRGRSHAWLGHGRERQNVST